MRRLYERAQSATVSVCSFFPCFLLESLHFVGSIVIISVPTIYRFDFNGITCFFFGRLNERCLGAPEILICDDHTKEILD